MKLVGFCFLLLSLMFVAESRPNIILFLADDFGYGDLSCYGHPSQERGAADRLAAEGLRFTQMYSAAVYCTPSRASMLTGRLPLRNGMYGDTPVLYHTHLKGLPKDEITVAEALKDAGYRTGMVGKWHLGVNENVYNDGLYLPYHHGFEYVGTILPFTLAWECDTLNRHKEKPATSRCYLYYNDTIIQQPINLENLSSALILDAKAFLHNMTEQKSPFFLYVSIPQVHTPMYHNPKFRGKSRRGIYGDQVNEMNWIVEEVMETVSELGFQDNTLSLFTSDHGPQREICEEGGDQGPFKGGKGYYFEGGLRVPAIAHWPGVIAPGSVSTAVVSLMDIFSTFLSVAEAQPPVDRIIDGNDFSKHFKQPSSESPHEILYFYCSVHLIAVRYKAFKIYFMKLPDRIELMKRWSCVEGYPTENIMGGDCKDAVMLDEPWVYNVEKDPREEYRITSIAPYILEDIKDLIKKHQGEMKPREPVLLKSTSHRKHIPCCNPPYCMCK